mgnify:CR=1 FL=1
MSKKININGNENVFFNNNVDFCVGTGRMGLALHKEYYAQLKLVQDAIGFKFIRGHGLFHDDMAIYQEYIDRTGLRGWHVTYNVNRPIFFTIPLQTLRPAPPSLSCRPR